MADDLRIDVIVATYNRCRLLGVALESLLKAHFPPDLDVKIVVADNNSTDETRSVVQSYDAKFKGRLKYVFEPRQGKSYALNTAIAETSGDLVGMIDDDEQVDEGWFEVVREWFRHPDVDFIGGPYKPNWESEPPAWLPKNFPGVIGIVDDVHEVRTFGKDYMGTLMGGNAVIRRRIFEEVGPYSTLLGRTDKNLLSCEDEDMHERIRAAGAHGKYVPELIIYHHIPASRLVKSYYRKWFFWRGVSKFVMNQQRREPVAHLFGVPRYLYGRAFRESGSLTKRALVGRLKSSDIFSAELRYWDLAGWLYGRRVHTRGVGR
jgi:glycosyltransferase involved in cell wall biosynthesis